MVLFYFLFLRLLISPQITGRITAYLPSGGPFVRMDSHVYPDYVVPPSYDSLLGKVCQSVLFYGIDLSSSFGLLYYMILIYVFMFHMNFKFV